MKLIWGSILCTIVTGLASITFDDISSGWNTLLPFLGAGLVLLGLIIIGNSVKKNRL